MLDDPDSVIEGIEAKGIRAEEYGITLTEILNLMSIEMGLEYEIDWERGTIVIAKKPEP